MKPWVIVRPRKAKEWVVFAMMIFIAAFDDISGSQPV